MTNQGPEHRRSLREMVAVAALALVSFEAPPVAAQNIRANTTWEEGVHELERVASQERREGSALYISTGTGGSFADLRFSLFSTRRNAENVSMSYARMAEAVDAAYEDALARGESPAGLRVLWLHTHPSHTLRRSGGRLGPAFEALVARNLPLTMPPSATDLEGPQMLDGIGLRGNLRSTPPDLVTLEYAVTDELLTYYYTFNPTSPLETERALSEYRDVAEELNQAVAEVTLFLETLPVDVITREGLIQNFDEIIVDAMYGESRWTTLDAFLRVQGQTETAERVKRAVEARRIAYEAAYGQATNGQTLDEARVAWARFVANAREAGESWGAIFSSDAYASLMSHYRTRGFDIRAVPNERAAEEDPLLLSPSSTASQ